MKRLLIMAAGTGGHIFPGVAIAQTMRARGWEVTWLGSMRGMERDIVPQHNIGVDWIDFSGMRGKGWRHTLTGLYKLAMSFISCFRIIGQRQPNVVLGMGGYVTVPGGMIARLRGVPLVLVNADATLLLSNKTLTPMANRVLFGFPGDFGDAASKAFVTGNPVREQIRALLPPPTRYAARSGPLRLLVVGGSLGAKALNDCLPAALARIPLETRPLVTHQAGKQHGYVLRQAYADAKVQAEVVDFIDDISAQYAQADIVICRAGAITVSEIAVAGVASVLVPLITSTTSHQQDNALWMAKQKAAIHLPQSDLTPERLASLLQSLTRESCLAMAKAAHAIGRRTANEEIAHVLEELVDQA